MDQIDRILSAAPFHLDDAARNWVRDTLTGLYRSSYFRHLLETEIARSRRHRRTADRARVPPEPARRSKLRSVPRGFGRFPGGVVSLAREIDEMAGNLHATHAVGERMVHRHDQCRASVGQAVQYGEPPQWALLVERRHRLGAHELEQRCVIRLGDRESP